MGVTVTFEQENMLNEVIPYAGSAPAYLYAVSYTHLDVYKRQACDRV